MVVGAPACTSPATEVLVALDTDIPTTLPLTITARLTGSDGSGGGSHTWRRGDGDAAAADAGAADDAAQPASVGYCLALPALAATPVIDGTPDAPLPLEPLIVATDSAGDPGGVTAEGSIAWRADGLYFYVRVHEATRTPAAATAAPAEFWCGDAVEFFVDPESTGLDTAFRATARQFMVPAPADATTASRRVNRYRVPTPNQLWTGAFGAFPTNDGYAVEAFVTAADLDLAAWSLDTRATAAIAVQVDVGGPMGSRPGGFTRLDTTISRYAQLTYHNEVLCAEPCNPSRWEGSYCTPMLAPP